MKAFISSIFDQQPDSWGLRGDPYFWNELKQLFDKVPAPYSESTFIERIMEQHKNVTGMPLNEHTNCFVDQYAHGGMSNGLVCGEFWIATAIPLLVDRLKKLNIHVQGNQKNEAGKDKST